MTISRVKASDLKVTYVSFPSILSGDASDDITLTLNCSYVKFPKLDELSQAYPTPVSHNSYYKDSKYTRQGDVEFKILANSDEYRQMMTILKFEVKIMGWFVRHSFLNERNNTDTILWYAFDTVIKGMDGFEMRRNGDIKLFELSVFVYMPDTLGLYSSVI